MHLAIYFDIHRYSSLSIEDVDPSLRLIEVRENNLTYNFHAVAWEFPDDERQTFSRLLGKKLIAGVSKEKSGIWPYNEKSAQEKNYVEFIIGYDDEGEEVYHSCDPDLLANYFGANPGSPHYLTPVYFRREVMTKYFNNPDKFSITDGYLHCGNLWGLRLDNNHANYIIVFLGDLGGLYYEEQMYWRSFNLLPGTSISDVNFKRSFLGEFADPERSDLLFKFRFEQFQEKWESHFGWPLFKPLNENDQYLYSALHVPLTNDQVEFDGQVLALTKIVIDSLNEKQIARFLQDLDPNSRGITKLEKFLELHKVSNSEQIIDFLKNLYTLRSTGIGHRKSKSYKKIAQVFKIGERDLILIFEEILNQLIALLNVLESEFLSG
jgi:hypothetical protein